MNPSIYVETSIPSFYYEVRTEPEMVAQRRWTREWWDDHSRNYDLLTSIAVTDELESGSFNAKADALALISDLPLLDIDESIADTVATYIAHHVMPNDPAGDALQLAIASWHKCDFLLTWNCRHLANANKFGHIRRINTLLGLFVPALVTPFQLLGQDP